MLRTLYQSDKLNSVSEGAEILYRRLLEVCDDAGNYHADPNLILGYAMAHRMGKVTAEDVKSRLQELVDVRVNGDDTGLIQIYDDGKLLHICNHFSRLRGDTQPDIRFRPVPGASRGRHGRVTLDRTEPNRTEPEGASGEPATPTPVVPKSHPDAEARAMMTWFYTLWEETHKPEKFPVKTVSYAKERAAANRLLKSYPDYAAKLTPILTRLFRGELYCRAPGCLAQFKPADAMSAQPKAASPTGKTADPRVAELERRADACYRRNPGCQGGKETICQHCDAGPRERPRDNTPRQPVITETANQRGQTVERYAPRTAAEIARQQVEKLTGGTHD